MHRGIETSGQAFIKLMSEVVLQFNFGFASLYAWLKKKLAPLLNQSEVKPKPKPTELTPTRFPALGADYMYLLCVLIGSFYCPHLL